MTIDEVTVVRRHFSVPGDAMERVEREGKRGFSVMDAEDLGRFEPIPGVDLPDAPEYVIADVDTGADLVNVTPDDALEAIRARGRSSLTIEEGIARLTHDPEALVKNACFSLTGSRCGDRRVAAQWISKGAPKLGWCWAGNPHTWLGSASCAGRVGV